MSHFEPFSRKRNLTGIFRVQRTLPRYSGVNERPRCALVNENRKIDRDFGTSPASNVGGKGAVTHLESKQDHQKRTLTGNVRVDW